MTRAIGALRLSLSAAMLAATTFGGFAASHREAPMITEHPKIDSTDLYVFRSYEPGREDYVTIIANYIPIQAPYGGPNYFTMDPDALYEIHIDNDGDAVEDTTFQFKFDNRLGNRGKGITLDIGGKDIPIPLRQAGQITRNDTGALNEFEAYGIKRIYGPRRDSPGEDLTRVSGNTRFFKPIDNVGEKTLPDYASYADKFNYQVNIPGCKRRGRVFVGQRAEAFAVNLGEVFDLVNLVPLDGDLFPGGIVQDRANDDLVGKANVTSIAMEIPIGCITRGGRAPIIGVWTSASLPGDSGVPEQKSRLSSPLVNELVIGLPDKDTFSMSEPKDDGQFADYVTNPTLPALVDLLFRDALGAASNIAPSNFPRTDLVAAFLTGVSGLNSPPDVTPSEMLRLNTAIPATLRDDQSPMGVVGEDLAGFPNGRRPGDDVVDIALRVVMGALCHPVPLGAELGVPGAVEDTESDLVELGFCTPEQAPVGAAPLTDGAPISAADLNNAFPYLKDPLPGSRTGIGG